MITLISHSTWARKSTAGIVISGFFLVFVSTPTTIRDYPKNFANFFDFDEISGLKVINF